MKVPQNNLQLNYLRTLAAGIFLTLISCGSSQNTAEAQQEYENLLDLVESREFEIEHQWANPMSGSSINLIGNANYIRFEGDSVQVFLPFFGVRYSGGGFGSSGGIEYEGPINNFRLQQNEENRELYLSFEGQQDSEDLEFLIKLFTNGKVTTSVNSSQRASISYQGEIQEF